MKNQTIENEKKQEKQDEEIIENLQVDEKQNNDYKQDAKPAKTKERILSIDRFRGLCFFAFVCSYILPLFGVFDFLTPYVEHDKNGFQILPGVSFADLFVPMFIFVIGLTIIRSFKSREEKVGTRKAYFQLATRFLALIGIGYAFNGFENGWADVFFNDVAFNNLAIVTQVAAIFFWLALAGLIIYIISLFFKNEKFKDISNKIFVYTLAIAGVLAIFFLLVSTAEKITAPAQSKFGGHEWDTLQNIGLAGLLALPFIRYDKWGRLIICGLSFVGLTILMQNGLFPLANTILEGGFIGAFSWSTILLLGSIFADLKDDKLYWVLSSLGLLISVVLIVGYDFIAAKRGCTPVFALFTASVASIIWGGFNFLENINFKFDFLKIWGSNAILTYITTLILALILDTFLGDVLMSLSVWATIPIVLIIFALFTLMNWLLVRKSKYIRI